MRTPELCGIGYPGYPEHADARIANICPMCGMECKELTVPVVLYGRKTRICECCSGVINYEKGGKRL